MGRAYALIDRENWRPYLIPVLLCGTSLLLATPAARVVQDLAGGPLFARMPFYLSAYAVSMGLLGLGLGATSAERDERGARLLLSLAVRVVLAQLLCLPYTVFAYSLSPGHGGHFLLLGLLTTLTAFVLALISRLVEGFARLRPSLAFLAKYSAFAAYHVLPLLWLPVASPIGAANRLFDEITPLETALAFAIPIGLALALISCAAGYLGVRRA